MNIFFALLFKLLPLYSLIFLGYITGKFLKISKEKIASLLIYFVIPVVIFTGVVTTKISPATLSIPLLFFLICCFISLLIFYVSGFIWKDSTKNILAFAAGSANTGYFGLPVAVALFGSNVVGIVTLTIMGSILYTNTLGFFLAAKGHHTTKESIMKIVKLPILYAFFLGLVVNLSGVRLADAYFQVVDYFIGAYSILGMMLAGLVLAEIKEYKIDTKFVGVALLTKFVLWPAVVLAIIAIDSHIFHIYDAYVHKVIMLMALVPIAINVVPYATLLKTQPEKLSLVVALSTLFALFYIPLITTIFF